MRRTTTAQQVADGLGERIPDGAFAPDERLRESAIAAEVGIARNTVREAVRILELSGLVRYEVNRGAVVISATVEQLDALYTARKRAATRLYASHTSCFGFPNDLVVWPDMPTRLLRRNSPVARVDTS